MSINFLRRPDKNEFGKRLEDKEAVKQKAANYFLRNKDVFALDEIWVRSDPKSREIVGKKLLDNEITDADKRRLLGAVQGPITLYGERNVLEGNKDRGYIGIRGNETEESILEAVMKLEPGAATTSDLSRFMSEYPTPLDFEPMARRMMQSVERRIPPEESAELARMRRAMGSFQKKVYGEQYDYYLAMKSLEADARKRSGERRPTTGERAPESVDRRRAREYGSRVLETREEPNWSVEENTITPERGRELVERAILDGDEFLMDRDGRLEYEELTTEDILAAELAPTHEIGFEGVKVGFSDVFLVSGKQEAAIGYVEKDGEVYARSYYRSEKTGMWKYLPDYGQDETGRVEFFGRGTSDESLILPAEIQAELNSRAAAEAPKPEEDEKRRELRRKVFYGTARVISRYEEVPEDWGDGDALYREVDEDPKMAFLDKVGPEQLMPIRDGSWPDFDKEVMSYKGKTRLSGRFTARVFESEDETFRWTMMEDKHGQAWVGQIELKAPVTSTGLRASWIEAGGFERSLYETPKTADKYGDYGDVKKARRRTGEEYTKYVSMWKKYWSKIPMIKEYKAWEAESRSD